MIKKKLRELDIFGSKVALMQNGTTTFKTIFGGMLTLIALGLMGFFIFVMVTHPVKISKTETNSTTNNITNNVYSTNSSKLLFCEI